MTDPTPTAPGVSAKEQGAAAAHDISADADMSADLLMALLGEDGAATALGLSADAESLGAAAALGESAGADSLAGSAEAYAQIGKKEIRARVKKLAGERPEMLARIITHWLKEERLKGR